MLSVIDLRPDEPPPPVFDAYAVKLSIAQELNAQGINSYEEFEIRYNQAYQDYLDSL